MRNSKLDQAKGLAIVLVVIGHTIQSLDVNFDANVFFKIIYSFHMPFFVLLSGASASFWVEKYSADVSLRAKLQFLTYRVFKSSIYLLLPFFSWTLFAYYFGKHHENLSSYLIGVINRPDLSLWFLPCIFWCILYLSVGLAVSQTIIAGISKTQMNRGLISRPDFQLLVIFLFWILIRTKIPDFFGSGMTNFFHGGLFFFFLCGILSQSNIQFLQKKIFVFSTAVVFALLVPFWSRVEIYNLTDNVPAALNRYYIGAIFTVAVAFFGSMFVYLGITFYGERFPNWISRTLSALGTQTLGIYALHVYFISVRPLIFAAIILSIAISLVIEKIPVLNTVLLGKKSGFIG